MKNTCGSKFSPVCCRPCNRLRAYGQSFVMPPRQPVGGAAASSKINHACIQNRCGHDGQRKRVAHMPTATTPTEDSRSKLVQNHPLVCLKSVYSYRNSHRTCGSLQRKRKVATLRDPTSHHVSVCLVSQARPYDPLHPRLTARLLIINFAARSNPAAARNRRHNAATGQASRSCAPGRQRTWKIKPRWLGRTASGSPSPSR